MPAHVVVITDPAKWAILRAFLAELEEGAIVIGPDAAAAFEIQAGQPIEEAMIEYDYGGECDIMLDWDNDPGLQHWCYEAIRKAQGLPAIDEESKPADP